MFLDIENKKLEVKYLDEEIELSQEIKRKIDSNWNKIINENPTLWDGKIACVSSVKIEENDIEIICKKSTYSHYLYL